MQLETTDCSSSVHNYSDNLHLHSLIHSSKYDFQIFTFTYLGLLAQLVENCTSIIDVMGATPGKA